MRLNGALKPHQGAPTYGRSTGAKKYRDKQQQRRCNNNNNSNNKRQRPCDWKIKARLLRRNNKNNNNCEKNQIIINSNNSNNRNNSNVSNSRAQEADDIESNNTTLTTIKTTVDISINNTTKINVKPCTTRNKKESATSQRQHKTQQQQENVTFDYENYHATRIATPAVAGDINDNDDNNFAVSTATTKMLFNIVGTVADLSSYNERRLHRLKSSSTQLLLLLPTMLLLLLSTFICCSAQFFVRLSATAVKMMRVQQSFMRATKHGSRMPGIQTVGSAAAATATVGGRFGGGHRGLAFSVLCLFSAFALLPRPVACDDADNFFAVNSFSMGPETTTPEFDYASRGQKKFGDKCDNTLECGFPGSICDPKKKSCQCTEDLPVTNHIDKCGKESAVNESCFFNEQCEMKYLQTECRDGRCVCRFEMSPFWGKDGSVECKGRQEKRGPETYIDPAMIGVLVGMALMFIIICVVLRLFAQARWRENRTIFNTPNPRLMNVSLLRDSKLLHGQERRGSRMSVRAPSRQPSMASLRPHSPNPSLGKTGSQNNSHDSNASATSLRSNSVAPGNIMNSHHERKGSSHHQHHHSQQHNQQQHEAHQQQHQQQQEPLITNITTNPAAESVTVEIIGREK